MFEDESNSYMLSPPSTYARNTLPETNPNDPQTMASQKESLPTIYFQVLLLMVQKSCTTWDV